MKTIKAIILSIVVATSLSSCTGMFDEAYNYYTTLDKYPIEKALSANKGHFKVIYEYDELLLLSCPVQYAHDVVRSGLGFDNKTNGCVTLVWVKK